ncbi:MAG: Na+/H+ antiporter subunit E [Sandaracinaceae bacterium]|nr:Na+/H+ antiporter subunit E [Sandaracinaceae bacterium]
MRTLATHLLLALGWCAITGELSPRNLLLGLLIGELALQVRPGGGPGVRYARRARRILEFALFTGWQTLRSALRVAYDVLTPTHHMRPAVLGVPLDATSDAEITLFAALVSLTPGSLSLDVSPDRKTLYVHVMYVGDPEETIALLKHGYERRVLELLR